jgi:hypothetical protein
MQKRPTIEAKETYYRGKRDLGGAFDIMAAIHEDFWLYYGDQTILLADGAVPSQKTQ